MSQLAFDFGPPPAPDFDNFVTGANAECVAALKALVASLHAGTPAAARFIYVWGPPGAGKTHLAQALLAGQAPGLLVADDCDRLDATAQQEIFHAFNRLTQSASGGFVGFGAVAPARLAVLPDLASRLAWGSVYRLEPLDDLAMRAAWEEAARARGLQIGEDVGAYLLRHARRNMGELKAILDRLDRLSLERKTPVTVALLRDDLQYQLARSSGPDATNGPEPAPGSVAAGHRMPE